MGSLNLQSASARTGLTKEQKKAAEAAIYGLPGYVPMKVNDEQRLTPEQQNRREAEVSEIRRILWKLDNQGAINE
jgi:hypothetical protein